MLAHLKTLKKTKTNAFPNMILMCWVSTILSSVHIRQTWNPSTFSFQRWLLGEGVPRQRGGQRHVHWQTWLAGDYPSGWKRMNYFLLSDHLTPKHGVQEEDVPNQCKLLLESVSYTLSEKNTHPTLPSDQPGRHLEDWSRPSNSSLRASRHHGTAHRHPWQVLSQSKSPKIYFFTKAGLDNSHCAWVGRLDGGRTCYGHRNRDE